LVLIVFVCDGDFIETKKKKILRPLISLNIAITCPQRPVMANVYYILRHRHHRLRRGTRVKCHHRFPLPPSSTPNVADNYNDFFDLYTHSIHGNQLVARCYNGSRYTYNIIYFFTHNKYNINV
jgi:hypothetical protein